MRQIFLIFIICTILSCSKDKKACWQGFSPSGTDVRGLLVCDKTLAEAEAQFPQYWFYNSKEKKYCWRVVDANGTTFYLRQVPISMTEKMKPFGGLNFYALDCNSFCIWTYHDKTRSKATGLYGPTRGRSEVYFGDTCRTLYVGRTIVLHETADSIYTREFKENVP